MALPHFADGHRAMQASSDDHDGPWKEALELFFPEAMALLAPALYQAIDWSYPPEFLDKELQAIGRLRRGGNAGRRLVDKLVRVRLREGAPALLLLHVEVQGRSGGPAALTQFTARMFEYRYLLHAHYRAGSCGSALRIYSLGILVDRASGPTHLEYRDEFLGQGVRFAFPVVNLAQWLQRSDELRAWAAHNPFAVVIMAQLQALRYPDKSARLAPLIALVRALYGYGYAQDTIRTLLRLVEWMVQLPAELERDYIQVMEQLEQENDMGYVTIAERLGMQKGREEGRVEGREEGREEGRAKGQADLLLRQIERRFGPVPEAVTQRVRTAPVEQLELWALNFVDAPSLEAVFRD